MKSLYALALLATVGVAGAQELATEVKSTEVVPGLYMLEGVDGFSSNMGLLVDDDHALLIDNGLAAITENLIRTAGELAGRPIDYVVNTHVHGDHVASNAALAASGATVIAHDKQRVRLAENPESAGGVAGLPVLTFAEAVTFHLGEQRAVAFHVAAAHTDGDAVIHFPDVNVIDAGDLFFNELFPFIDLDSGGSVDGYIEGQRRIIALADETTKIIPGHGPLASRADLQAALDMLVDASSRVKKLVDKGLSEDEVLAANPLADYDARWSWFFITTPKMTSTLYRAHTQKQKNSR